MWIRLQEGSVLRDGDTYAPYEGYQPVQVRSHMTDDGALGIGSVVGKHALVCYFRELTGDEALRYVLRHGDVDPQKAAIIRRVLEETQE